MRKQLSLFLMAILLTLSGFATKYTNATGGGNWSSTSTWAGGVLPSSTEEVRIRAGDVLTVNGNYKIRSIRIGAATGSVAKLVVSAGKTLTLEQTNGSTVSTTASTVMRLYDGQSEVTVDGTLIFECTTNGRYNMIDNGLVTSTKEFTIEGSGNIRVTSNKVVLAGVDLTVECGVQLYLGGQIITNDDGLAHTATSNGKFTLDNEGRNGKNGRITKVTGTTSNIIGEYEFRYRIRPFPYYSTGGWTMLATPMDVKHDTIFNNIASSGYVGSSGGGSWLSVFRYDQSLQTSGCPTQSCGWLAAANTTNDFTRGEGYWMFAADTTMGAAGNQVMDLTGETDYATEFSKTTVYNSAGNSGADGWNLFGNPYAGTLDLNHARANASSWTASNMVWDYDSESDQYVGYNTVMNSVNASYMTVDEARYVAAGEGFWVENIGTSSSTFKVKSSSIAEKQTMHNARQSQEFDVEDHFMAQLGQPAGGWYAASVFYSDEPIHSYDYTKFSHTDGDVLQPFENAHIAVSSLLNTGLPTGFDHFQTFYDKTVEMEEGFWFPDYDGNRPYNMGNVKMDTFWIVADTNAIANGQEITLLEFDGGLNPNQIVHFEYFAYDTKAWTDIPAGGVILQPQEMWYNHPFPKNMNTIVPIRWGYTNSGNPPARMANPTGIDEVDGVFEFDMIPNPATDIVNITTTSNKRHTGTILNMTGQTMETFKIVKGKASVDVSGYTSGIYFLNIEGNVEKLIVQ